jgi:hypothetical protein
VAYLAAQELDRRLGNPRSNDMILLGGMVTRRERAWTPLGTVMHLLAGATFGVTFETVVAPRLRGPYWLRGVVMAQAENVALWPLVILMDRLHPAVESGALAPMNHPIYFAQAAWRHLALGAVMGLVLGTPADGDDDTFWDSVPADDPTPPPTVAPPPTIAPAPAAR